MAFAPTNHTFPSDSSSHQKPFSLSKPKLNQHSRNAEIAAFNIKILRVSGFTSVQTKKDFE
jgi:hypothetical protein